jgi:hypothetical protein
MKKTFLILISIISLVSCTKEIPIAPISKAQAKADSLAVVGYKPLAKSDRH